ncbi:hypothetical protein [Actinomadura sp. DC4]|uniref:hypothetical protein n=1 Tax=Actinomadura sp. DC4 TaxID=3055069 RepID=UPI0025B21CEC|nr:hypothetical protein [Actinomadura sp. DC4]MDN3358984.1 hypothetical protein [Actinomadura sp. DC4]
MADDPAGVPSVPGNANWPEWTFEQALAAVTGEGADLHAAANAEWLQFNSGGSETGSVSYHAFDHYYFAVDFNEDAINAWAAAVAGIDAMMNDVGRGRRGSMDLQSLRDLEMAIKMMAVWADGTAHGLHAWAGSVNTADSAIRGKAAFLVRWRLKANGDGLTDTHEQLTSRHGAPIADAVGAAGDALQAFNTSMVNAWQSVSGLRDFVVERINAEVAAVMDWIHSSRIVKGDANYALDDYDTAGAKTFIQDAMSRYPLGDLSTAAGWSAINRRITADVTAKLKGSLDPPAQAAIARLQPAYQLAASALVAITPPPAETMPKPSPDTDGPDGKGPPDPDGGADGKDLPDPNAGADGKDLPDPNAGADGKDLPDPHAGADGTGLPDPSGGADGEGLPDPSGDGLLDPGGGPLDPSAGGGADLSNPGAGGGLPSPGDVGAGGADPAAGGLGGTVFPGLTAPGGGSGSDAGGTSTVGPGGDGAFVEPGGPGDGRTFPVGDGDLDPSILSPGAGRSDTVLPPGTLPPGGGAGDLTFPGAGQGAGNGGGLSIGHGAGAQAGAGGLPGGFGGGPGGSGVGGGFAAVPGGGGNGMPTPAQAAGPAGPPGAASSGDGSGGVPFFPPMMGGAGAGGEKPQERQRQTWLAEDEEIWGTTVAVGSGVIGRLGEDDEFEAEEMFSAAAVRGRRRTDPPRRPRTEPQEAQQETGGSTAAG